MAFIDYYKILGIAKDTPQEKIKSAYKKRARQFHPDLHPDDPKAKAKFQALTEAFDVLNDPEKRKKYDQYGEHWKEAGAFGGAGGSGIQTHPPAQARTAQTAGFRHSARCGLKQLSAFIFISQPLGRLPETLAAKPNLLI